MLSNIRFKFYSIIENHISKTFDDNKKISELFDEYYQENEFIYDLKIYFNITEYDIKNLSIKELSYKIDSDIIYQDTSIEFVIDQHFKLWCDRYLYQFTEKNFIDFLKDLNLEKEKIHIFKKEVIENDIKVNKTFIDSKLWCIKFAIDIVIKYGWNFPDDLLKLKNLLDENRLILIPNNLEKTSIFSKENIKLYNCYWNYLRNTIFSFTNRDNLDEYFYHVNIVNKLDPDSLVYIKYKSTINSNFEKLYHLVKNKKIFNSTYKFFGNVTNPYTHINDKGLVIYQEIKNTDYENFNDYFNNICKYIQVYDILNNNYQLNSKKTELYVNIIKSILNNGLIVKEYKIVLIEFEKSEITEELLKAFLQAGCEIILGINNNNYKFYKDLYEIYGGYKSSLTIIPFNIYNDEDTNSFIEYCIESFKGIINIFIPIFYEKNVNNNNISCLPEYLVIYIDKLVKYYKNNKLLGTFTKILIPFIPNNKNYLNNAYSSEYQSNYLYKLNEKYTEYFQFISINCGWIREREQLSHTMLSENLNSMAIFTLKPNELILFIISIFHPDMENSYMENFISINISLNLKSNADFISQLNQFEKSIYNKINYKRFLYSYKTNNYLSENEYSSKRYNYKSSFPVINEDRCNKLNLKDIPIDRESVVVIIGYGENSYYSTARTRINIEQHGNVSLESCIELAWYFGLIEYKENLGWYEISSGNIINESEIYLKYEKDIVDTLRIGNNGIIEQNDFHNLHILKEDLKDIKINSKNEENFLQNKYKQNVSFYKKNNILHASLKKGCCVTLTNSTKNISSTIRNTNIYGIPPHLLEKMEESTLYTIVAVSESLISAGISDPYEIYQYISISDIGSVIGRGNTYEKNIKLYEKLINGENLDNNISQESKYEIIHTTISYWINKVLINYQGPKKIPDSGYSAYAMSLEMGIELIQQQKAKIVFVGSTDDNKITTCNPLKLSHPFQNNASSILIITTGELAINSGFPIYGICGYVHSSLKLSELNTLYNEDYKEKIDTNTCCKNRINNYNKIMKLLPDINEDLRSYIKKYFGHEYFKNDDKIPNILGALSTWGLNINDISLGVYTNYLTNRQINDSTIIQKQMEHLNRIKGNILPVLLNQNFAFNSSSFGSLINNLLNAFQTGNIINNNNHYDLSPKHKKNDYLYFPEKNIQIDFLKSILLKNISEDNNTCVELLLIHPEYLLSTLSLDELDIYKHKLKKREYVNFRILDNVLYNKRNLIHFKTNVKHNFEHSYSENNLANTINMNLSMDEDLIDHINEELKISVNDLMLNEIYNENDFNDLEFNEKSVVNEGDLVQIFQQYSKKIVSNNCRGVGIELKLISDVCSVENEYLIKKVFTSKEMLYITNLNQKCYGIACCWAAKESIIKSLKSLINHEELDISINENYIKDIEIIISKNESIVQLHNNLKKIINSLKINDIKISMSHSKFYAFAHTVLT